ncbi:MAG: type transport system permease protein [Solirubrobacteraceae bacterium]|jgi:ABC-2 type transport system permease protein|nr:type transport system permease protein [Solirubrobacteraceae bacterium]
MATLEAADGFRIVKPSAVSGDWRRTVYLAVTLALTELKVRFFDSALGYLWSLMRPLMFFGVLYLVFNQIIRAGDTIDFYPVVLLMGIVLYTFVAEATGDSVESMIKHESLIRRVAFPRLVIPLAVTVTAVFNLLMNLIVVFVFIALAGVEIRWTWLELPVLLALLMALSLGIALLLSVLYVRFRDIKPIWQVVLQATFYATPILYPVEVVRQHYPGAVHYVMCNPLAAINQQIRYAVLDPTAPSAGQAIGGVGRLAVPLAIIVVMFVAGLVCFVRMAPTIAEEL